MLRGIRAAAMLLVLLPVGALVQTTAVSAQEVSPKVPTNIWAISRGG
jgi:hypothetical protein